MSPVLRALVLASFPVAAFVASASGQDEKKSAPKSRLPNFWKSLDLTDDQREKYYEMAAARDERMDALKQDIAELQTKLAEMKKKLKDFDDGAVYLTILTKEQKDKLVKLKAESAKRSAEKKLAKATEDLKAAAKTTKTRKSDAKGGKKSDAGSEQPAESKTP